MRLLHTSDWHLGRSLYGHDLLDAQEAFLRGLVGLVGDAGVDAVVVAGDVYDRAVPPVEAVQLLEDVLAALDVPVVVLAGNHDSAVRLGFGRRLFRAGLHVRTGWQDVGRPVELVDGHGPVLVYPVPFLDPDACRRPLAPEGSPDLPRTHEAVLGAAMDRVRADLARRPGGTGAGTGADGPRVRAVVAAHAFVVGGAGCDSERDIRVGGVDTVAASVFAGVDYVALGHLHGAQEPAAPDGRTALRYSGSPLRYSFSEEAQRKGVTLVDLDGGGVAGVEHVPVAQPRGMRTLRGPLADVLADTGAADDWLRVVVTDARRPDGLHERLRGRFAHVLAVLHEPEGLGAGARRPAASRRASADPVQVAADFVEHVTGAAAAAEELAAFRSAYEHVRDAARSA